MSAVESTFLELRGRGRSVDVVIQNAAHEECPGSATAAGSRPSPKCFRSRQVISIFPCPEIELARDLKCVPLFGGA